MGHQDRRITFESYNWTQCIRATVALKKKKKVALTWVWVGGGILPLSY